MAEDVFEVEAIVDSRMVGRRRQYRVRWLGYPPEEDTWEDVSNLNCDELVAEYWEKEKQKQAQVASVSPQGVSALQKLKPQKVIGLLRQRGEIYYVVELESGKIARVRGVVLKQVCPELAIDFLCTRLELQLTAGWLGLS